MLPRCITTWANVGPRERGDIWILTIVSDSTEDWETQYLLPKAHIVDFGLLHVHFYVISLITYNPCSYDTTRALSA